MAVVWGIGLPICSGGLHVCIHKQQELSTLGPAAPSPIAFRNFIYQNTTHPTTVTLYGGGCVWSPDKRIHKDIIMESQKLDKMNSDPLNTRIGGKRV